jgi:fatty acid desaturase
MARERTDPAAIRITSAAASRNEDIAKRQKKYLLSMSLRTICFVGAIIASLAGIHWLWPILIAGALVLPYLAVVMANAATTRHEGIDLMDHGVARRQLGPGDAPR